MSFSSGAYFGSHSTVSQGRAASAAREALLVWIGPLSRTRTTGVARSSSPDPRSRAPGPVRAPITPPAPWPPWDPAPCGRVIPRPPCGQKSTANAARCPCPRRTPRRSARWSSPPATTGRHALGRLPPDRTIAPKPATPRVARRSPKSTTGSTRFPTGGSFLMHFAPCGPAQRTLLRAPNKTIREAFTRVWN